jgi:hypothetical protein
VRIPKSRGDRATAVIATAVVGALVIAAAVFGVGISSANPALADVGAWLWSSSRGAVVHANGLSGEVDGRITATGSKGRQLKVVEDGATVLLVDEQSGVVSRIEPSQLKVTQTRNFETIGLQLVVAGDIAYAIDPEGTVQRIDPATLDAVGPAIPLPRPLGGAGIDGGGRLWVPVPADGEIVPVRAGVREKEIKVGEPGDPLALTIAGGLPIVTNTRTSSATVIGEDGSTGRIALPAQVAGAGDEPVLSPVSTEGPLAPILVPGPDGLVVVIDTDSRAPQSVKLSSVADPENLGVPQMLGSRVYIPDSRTGGLVVWDSATGGAPQEIPISGRPGKLDVFVKDGQLWANDQAGDRAVVIDVEGRRHEIDKNDEDVPGPTRTPKPMPTPKAQPTGEPDPSRPPDPVPTEPVEEPDPVPTPTKTRKPTPTPSRTPSPTPSAVAPRAPGTVSARSGPGKVDVMFSPSPGGEVAHYTLTASPSGGEVTPQRVDAEGPFQFEFRGGDCGTDYTFTVVAHWEGGEVSSEPSAGAKPCVAPGTPSGFQAKAKNKGADLTWSAPGNAGEGTTYALTGAVTKNGVAGTSFSAEGLKNNAKHEFTLKARNAAGEGEGSVSATVDLAYPKQAYKNKHNNQTNTLIRSGPQKAGDQNIGTIPQGEYRTLTVICQVKGMSVTESESNETSDIWNRIEWNGGVGYLSDTLMETPRGGFPAAPLFQCDD